MPNEAQSLVGGVWPCHEPFLAITFVLCVGFDLVFPQMAMYRSWQALLPGFTWISWSSFLLGLVESYGYGWYVALIWVPLYNVLSARAAR